MSQLAARQFQQIVDSWGGPSEVDPDTMLAMCVSCHILCNLGLDRLGWPAEVRTRFAYDMAFPVASAIKAAARDQWDTVIPLPPGILHADGSDTATVRQLVEANHLESLVPIQKMFMDSIEQDQAFDPFANLINGDNFDPFNGYLDDQGDDLLWSDDNDNDNDNDN